MKTFSQLSKNITEKFLDIDNLRHANVEEKPVDNYKGDYKNLNISKPSENTSSQTRLELKTMQGLMKGRTPEIEQSVKNHDRIVNKKACLKLILIFSFLKPTYKTKPIKKVKQLIKKNCFQS